MQIDNQEDNVEAVTMTDILNLSTWDRPRSNDELLSFIARREITLSDVNDIDDAE